MSEYRKGGWKIGCLIFLGAISLSTVSAILMIMNSGKIAEKAEKAVSIYHNALKSGNCQQISAMKSSGRLKAKGLDVLEGACDVLKRKYGILRSSQATGSQLKIGSASFSTSGGSSSGDYIVLQYVSTFSNSSVQFIVRLALLAISLWLRKSGESCRLGSHHNRWLDAPTALEYSLRTLADLQCRQA